MIHRNIRRIFLSMLCALMIFSVASAYAANIVVPSTRLTNQASAVTANTLKPAACSAITLTRLVVCTGGNCDGTSADELLVGTAGGERIRGRGGSDCILGGGGDDDLVGNGRSDVCIGGPGNDAFTTCEVSSQ